MHGIGRLLRVNPGEGRVVARVLAMMVLVWGGFAVGGNAVEGLLFARYGPSALPYLFVALGVATTAVMLGMNALLARPRPHRLLLLFLPGMAVVIVVLRAVLLVGARWVYPASWLVMMILWTLVGVVTWGIAGAVHDTRQAKRLFPLYGAGIIVGAVAGGLLTGPLAKALGAENLVLLWAAAAGAGFLPARSALRLGGAGGLAKTRTRAGSRGPSAWRRIAEGARQVRSTGLLRWMFASLAMFAILYFTLSLLFARAATARYPSADRLAAFFGLFTALASGAALLVSLFLSNRLAARFGLATMVLVLPVVYAAGFSALIVSTAFTAVLLFRFVQMVWVNGVWAGAWQAQYNVIPPERRDGTRAFIDGIGSQVGVAMAGVMLILAQSALPTRALPPIGLVVAVLAIAAAWRARRMYARAVVDALRAGNPEVFLPGGAPFGGDRPDAVAAAAVTAGLSDADPAVRRVAMEVVAATPDASALPHLLLGLDDGDPSVRAAALRGMGRLDDGDGAAPRVGELTADPDPEVRRAAVGALAAHGVPPAQVDAVRAALEDTDPTVRAAAAAALLATSAETDARDALREMTASPDPDARAAAFAVLAAGGEAESVAAALGDRDAAVRRAAVHALPEEVDGPVAAAMTAALADEDRDVRAEATRRLVRVGEGVRSVVLEARSDPGMEPGAMAVLARLDGAPAPEIRDYAAREVAEAARYGDLLAKLDGGGDGRAAALAHAARHRSLAHGLNALTAVGGLWDEDAVATAMENIDSRDAGQRANALETLESVGEPAIVRPLVRAWERTPGGASDTGSAIAEGLRDGDPWVRACAAFAAGDRAALRLVLEALARDDPDTLVRDTASAALEGDGPVETLANLSLVERVTYLVRAPLFAKLSPSDIQRVAEIAAERAHADGDVIAEQGEPGDEMFVVVSGEIAVVLGGDGESPVEVARRGAGEAIGEMAVISHAPRMASIVATGDVRLLAIDRRRFERILRDRPDVALAVMDVLCSRLRESSGAMPHEAGV